MVVIVDHCGYEKTAYLCRLILKQKRSAFVKEYRIQFSGLAEGIHSFRYVLERSFFAHFEDERIEDGRVVVDVTMDRQQRMLVFSFDISGEVLTVCDVCTDPLRVKVAGDEQLIARISNSGEEDDTADIVFIAEEAFEFDLTQHMYDYVRLLLPLRLTHEESVDGTTCDPEMLKLLEQYRASQVSGAGMEALAHITFDKEDNNDTD